MTNPTPAGNSALRTFKVRKQNIEALQKIQVKLGLATQDEALNMAIEATVKALKIK